MKFLLLITISLSSLCCFLEGSDNTRSCRIIFLERPTNAPKEVHLFDGVISRNVQLPRNDLSEAIALPEGDLILSLTPDRIIKDFPEGTPTLKVSANINYFYLIVVSDPENKILPLRLLPVDEDAEATKVGQTYWLNLTEHAIKAELGKESLLVPPESRVISNVPLDASGYYKADFLYKRDGEGEYAPIMKKSWWHDAKSRNLGFILNTSRGLPKIFTLRDKLDIN